MIDLRAFGPHPTDDGANLRVADANFDRADPHDRELANHLQRAGYSELDVQGTPGRYILHGAEMEIRPSSESYFGARTGWLLILA